MEREGEELACTAEAGERGLKGCLGLLGEERGCEG